MAAILEAAAKEKYASITKLTYGSLLSHHQIVSHVRPLIEEQLLEYHEKTYPITEKGLEFLKIYNNLVKSLSQ